MIAQGIGSWLHQECPPSLSIVVIAAKNDTLGFVPRPQPTRSKRPCTASYLPGPRPVASLGLPGRGTHAWSAACILGCTPISIESGMLEIVSGIPHSKTGDENSLVFG